MISWGTYPTKKGPCPRYRCSFCQVTTSVRIDKHAKNLTTFLHFIMVDRPLVAYLGRGRSLQRSFQRYLDVLALIAHHR